METIKRVKEHKRVLLLVILAVLLLIFLLIFAFQKDDNINLDKNNIFEEEQSLEDKIIEKVGKGSKIKTIEKYEDFDKISVDLKGMSGWPTPNSEAVIFAKNNEIVPMSENYAKEIISKDIEELDKSENPIGGELESSKYFEEFSGFNDGKTYKKVYINSIKLNSPFPSQGDDVVPGELNYEIIVIDEFGNILFRTFSNHSF